MDEELWTELLGAATANGCRGGQATLHVHSPGGSTLLLEMTS